MQQSVVLKKEELSIKPPDEGKAYEIYNDALTSMKKGEFFYAANKFSEAEKILPVIEHSAKSIFNDRILLL